MIYIFRKPNIYAATIGLRIEPLPPGSGIEYVSEVSYGNIIETMQTAVREGVFAGCKHGLYGWEITDARIVFDFAEFSSVDSSPADFRRLAPHVLGKALRSATTLLLEPVNAFSLDVPNLSAGSAAFDIAQMRGSVDTVENFGDFTRLTGSVPAETSRGYFQQVLSYTKGKGVYMARHLGYFKRPGTPVDNLMWQRDTSRLHHMFLQQEQQEQQEQ